MKGKIKGRGNEGKSSKRGGMGMDRLDEGKVLGYQHEKG